MQEAKIYLVDRDTFERVKEVDWKWVEDNIELISSGKLYEMGLTLEL